jgi:hypothetical protein
VLYGIDIHQYQCEVDNTTSRNTIAGFVQSIKKHHGYLKDRVEKYGGTLLARWKKKSGKDRSDLIRQALPDIAAKPPIFLRHQQGLLDRVTLGAERVSWLLPYLDLETLSSEPLKLLALLHFRTVHETHEWALLDFERTEIAWKHGAVAVDFNPLSVRIDKNGYGKLQAWSQEAAHRITIGYPRAKLLFEAQT